MIRAIAFGSPHGGDAAAGAEHPPFTVPFLKDGNEADQDPGVLIQGCHWAIARPWASASSRFDSLTQRHPNGRNPRTTAAFRTVGTNAESGGIQAFTGARADGKVAPGSARSAEDAFRDTRERRHREADWLRSAGSRDRRVVVPPDNRDKMPVNKPARSNLAACGDFGVWVTWTSGQTGEVAVTDIPADIGVSACRSARLRRGL